MKLRNLREQIEGEYISKDDDTPEMDTLEERLNQALKRFGNQDNLWADVDEQSGEIEVSLPADDMIPLSQVNAIARLIRDTAMAELVGISGGTQFAIYLHFKR